MIRWLTTILQGIGIGLANVIPGVSGGTMALIFGIYERLINVVYSAVQSGILLLKLDFSGALIELRRLPWLFILPLAAGIIIAPLAGARFIPALLESNPSESRGLFFGLILGSIAIPWLRIRKPVLTHWLFLAAGAIVAFLLSGLPPTETTDPSLIWIFTAGAIAMSAMILPGVSGAYLLLIMGLYSPILNALDQRDVVIVLVFMAGAGVGVGAFSLFLGWLLRIAHDHTMAVLVGLMIGSLRALWPWMGPDRELMWMGGGASAANVFGLIAAGLVVSGGILLWEIRQNIYRGSDGGGDGNGDGGGQPAMHAKVNAINRAPEILARRMFVSPLSVPKMNSQFRDTW